MYTSQIRILSKIDVLICHKNHSPAVIASSTPLSLCLPPSLPSSFKRLTTTNRTGIVNLYLGHPEVRNSTFIVLLYKSAFVSLNFFFFYKRSFLFAVHTKCYFVDWLVFRYLNTGKSKNNFWEMILLQINGPNVENFQLLWGRGLLTRISDQLANFSFMYICGDESMVIWLNFLLLLNFSGRGYQWLL